MYSIDIQSEEFYKSIAGIFKKPSQEASMYINF